jgi:hypothetical protein
MTMPQNIVFTHRELHMMGDCVAVCWNLRNEIVNRLINGVQFSGVKKVRYGNPYIDFVTVDVDSHTGQNYENDDSSVAGGISPEYAKQIVEELQRAIEYIKTVE